MGVELKIKGTNKKFYDAYSYFLYNNKNDAVKKQMTQRMKKQQLESKDLQSIVTGIQKKPIIVLAKIAHRFV